jgi:hypothetical protein
MNRRIAIILTLVFALAALAGATDLTGTVTNKTNNKPAVGADVILLKLAQGMDEAGRTKTDARGHYSIKLDNDGDPHLVRVVFKDVTYHKQAPPGTTSADVDVYDSAPKLDGVDTSVNILRIEPQNGQANVMELYAVKNASSPPRTLMTDSTTFNINLPPDATIDSALVASPGGLPIQGSPIPGKKNGQFGFLFPLRPGETRFQISYHMPYSGSLDWKPQVAGTLEHLVVMVPKDVTLTPSDPNNFQNMPDEQGATVRVATNVDANKNVAFKLSGTGTFPPDTQNPQSPGPVNGQGPMQEGADAQAQTGGAERPGGGIGAPINAPNPLQQYLWWIVGGFVVVVGAGAAFLYFQPPAEETGGEAPAPARTVRATAARAAAAASPAARTSGNGHSNLLLAALKEELFTLETDKASGKLSAEDYKKYKSALDVTLQRALSRQKN